MSIQCGRIARCIGPYISAFTLVDSEFFTVHVCIYGIQLFRCLPGLVVAPLCCYIILESIFALLVFPSPMRYERVSTGVA